MVYLTALRTVPGRDAESHATAPGVHYT